jgi:hypothetical protein
MERKSQTYKPGKAIEDTSGGFVQLVEDLTPQNARVLLGRLYAEGIDGYLSGAEAVEANSQGHNALGGVGIFVRAQQQSEAHHIMAIVNGGNDAMDDPEEEGSRRKSIRARRLFGWAVVLLIAVVLGGFALEVIWAPSYEYFPYSITPEPTSRIVGKWVLSALLSVPVVFWLIVIEVSIKRKYKR